MRVASVEGIEKAVDNQIPNSKFQIPDPDFKLEIRDPDSKSRFEGPDSRSRFEVQNQNLCPKKSRF